MTDPSAQRVLEFRYGLYSRAYDAVLNRCGANELLRLHAEALGCRRAAEVVELAEQQVECGFPQLDAEHLTARIGGCADCVRNCCLLLDENALGLDATAMRRSRGGWNAA